MKFLIILILIPLFITMVYYKTKSEKLDKKIKEKSTVLKDLDMTKKDEKLLSEVFNKKIKRVFFQKTKKKYNFFYKKNEFLFGRQNTKYDIITMDVNKVSINDEVFFNVEVRAWEKLLDYKAERQAEITITDIVSNPKSLEKQVSSGVENLFNKLDSKLEEEINIETV